MERLFYVKVRATLQSNQPSGTNEEPNIIFFIDNSTGWVVAKVGGM